MKLKGERRCPLCLQPIPRKPPKCPKCNMKVCPYCLQRHMETHYIKIRL